MTSRRADRVPPHSHARPKRGQKARRVVLALSVITVATGVGVTLATGGGNQGDPSEKVETNAAAEAAEQAAKDLAADKATPLASPSVSPSKKASPSPSVKPKPKPKPKPQRTVRPSAPKTQPQSGNGGAERPAPPKPDSGNSGGGSSNGTEDQVVALVNKERASAGCSPVTANAKLTRAADDYSDVMADSGVMSHTGPDGSTMTSRVEAAGYQWSTLGENIARGQADAASVMDSWMNSEGHRANILNCSFKEIGVGVHVGSGGPWWTQNFGASR